MEEEKHLDFPAKDSADEKACTAYYSLFNFIFLPIKAFSFPCWVRNWICQGGRLQFSADSEKKSIFAGEISGRLSVSGQQVSQGIVPLA